jgi:RecA/RadA recombinase
MARTSLKSWSAAVGKKAAVPAPGPLALVETVGKLGAEISHCLRTAQEEQTKRAAISADLEVALSTLRTKRQLFTELMQHTFAERARVIDQAVRTLDDALARGDVALADSALRSMVGVVQTSPFKGIGELRDAMTQKDFVMRLE